MHQSLSTTLETLIGEDGANVLGDEYRIEFQCLTVED
jgi:hypothetical protein